MPEIYTTRVVRRLAAAVLLATAASGSLVWAADGKRDPVLDAVLKGDASALRSLVKAGAPVSTPQPDGSTPVMWAAHRDDLASVAVLISAGADVNAGNDYGVRALHLACEHGSLPMVESLLRAGADVNGAQSSGTTALMLAARTGNADIVKQLLARGARVNVMTVKTNQTPLMFAISDGHLPVVRQLLEAGAEANFSSSRGFTPLMYAVLGDDLDMAKALVAAGARVNERGALGDTALPLAIVSGKDRIAYFLLDQGADPNGTIGGVGALHAAVGSVDTWLRAWLRKQRESGGTPGLPTARRVEMVKALLAKGADPNGRITAPTTTANYLSATNGAFNTFATGTGNLKGATPLWVATFARAEGGPLRDGTPSDVYVDAGATGMMRILLAAGADPNLVTADGTTPVMVAAGLGGGGGGRRRPDGSNPALDRVKLLLGAGANINATNEARFTALHGAAFTGNEEVIKHLVEQRADINAQDFRGRTPFRLAEGSKQAFALIKQPEVAALLKTLGADASLGPSWEVLERQLAREIPGSATAGPR